MSGRERVAEKLERLALISPDDGRAVEDEWPLTLAALRAGEPDDHPILRGDLALMLRVLEAELNERIAAWAEVAA